MNAKMRRLMIKLYGQLEIILRMTVHLKHTKALKILILHAYCESRLKSYQIQNAKPLSATIFLA